MKSFVGLAFLVGALGLTACAAKTPLAKAQIGAVTAGQAAVDLYSVEQALYKGHLYDQPTHRALLIKEKVIVTAARAYEKAVAGCSAMPCSNVNQAQQSLSDALTEFEKVVPSAVNVKTALEAAAAAVKVYLAKATTAGPRTPDALYVKLLDVIDLDVAGPPLRSQEIPAGGAMVILGLMESLIGFYKDLRKKASENGATPEQLAAVDAQLGATEDAIDAELNQANPTA